jgi:class 3 adenylate cyclase
MSIRKDTPLAVNVSELLEEAAESAREELSAAVEIVDVDHVPAPDEMFVDSRKWLRMRDVVVVVVDLKNSTKLTWDEAAKGSARVYEAVTGNVVRIIKEFRPGFVDIQGDGMFAIFGGEDRYERAVCAAITIKTFSEKGLLPAIEDHVEEKLRDTGLKVGMAAGMLAVKRVGKSRDQSEPIWAGKQVNWASKCAGAADRNELIITERVFNRFKDNEFVRYSCRCQTPKDLWSDTQVTKLPEQAWNCKLLKSRWCDTCGEQFCRAVLDGETSREDVDAGAIRRGTATAQQAA